MNAEQKQRAVDLIDVTKTYRLDAEECAMQMAALLQELVDAPAPEPFGYFKSEPFGWTDCAETDDGAIALYTAPPAPSVPDGWRSAIAKEFPLYDEDGLDEDKHCCEWVMLQERKRLHKMLAAPPPPKLSDERILEICGFRPESSVEVGADIIRKRWLEIARAIEREILGGTEK